MFQENLDVFLGDMGVQVIFGSQVGYGILDEPDQAVGQGFMLSTDYTLTYKTVSFTGLMTGSPVTVDGVPYKIREMYKIDDGAFTKASLTKV